MKKYVKIIAIAVSTLLLVSCSNYINSADDFYGGDVVNAEMLSSIAESIFASDESLRPETEPVTVDESSGANDDEVTTEETSEDSLTEDATEEITEDNTDVETVTEEATTEEETTKREHNGIYYWTESGEVYHKWSDCGHIKNSLEVFSGTIYEAKVAGKERVCSACANK